MIYKSQAKGVDIRIKLDQETVWLSLDQMFQLFDRNKSVISRHLKNIFDSNELDQKSTVAKNATVQLEGGRKVTRNIEFYNLDVTHLIVNLINKRNQ